MTTDIEYALMSGASYISNRDLINQFPVPQGWTATRYDLPPDGGGFEAISFFNGESIETSTEIVISFAGTHGDLSKVLSSNEAREDWIANYELETKGTGVELFFELN